MTLKEFFTANPRVALAFSGGVDSAFLLSQAVKYAADVHAYFVKSQFQPEFELRDAVKLSGQVKAPMTIIDINVLDDEKITENENRRCYYCKTRIFESLISQAKADGYTVIMDGTNASDEVADRPGMQALQELKVCSPLRECDLTKAQIRHLSKEEGLFTHDKPAYACLATRIPTGTKISGDMLTRVEKSEDALFKLGFSDFRVRVSGDGAKLQFPENQFFAVLEKREIILTELSAYFSEVTLDLKSRN